MRQGLAYVAGVGAGANIAENAATDYAAGDSSKYDTLGGAAAEVLKDGSFGAAEATFGKVIAGPVGAKASEAITEAVRHPASKALAAMEAKAAANSGNTVAQNIQAAAGATGDAVASEVTAATTKSIGVALKEGP